MCMIMVSYNLVGLVLTAYLAVAFPVNDLDKKDNSGPQPVMAVDKLADQETELLKLMETPANDDTGKAIPVPIPKKIISGGAPVGQPGKDWGRKMNEEEWRQQHSKLNAKPHDVNKKVMHNRNTINDNRHDKKGMKIPRHLP